MLEEIVVIGAVRPPSSHGFPAALPAPGLGPVAIKAPALVSESPA
jgi:hypothetical protein